MATMGTKDNHFVRVNDAQHRALKTAAAILGVNMNDLVNKLIEREYAALFEQAKQQIEAEKKES